MKRKIMLFIAILMCFTVMAVVNLQADTTITTNQTGTHDGYYYYFWTDGVGSVNMNLGPGGNYSVNWSNCGEFICGKGWNTGSDRTITYSGSFNPGINSFLTVYGFARDNPTVKYTVEYYVVENYGVWTPPGGTPSGTISSDGGTYNIYRTQRNSVISIIDSFQYWSVRTTKRSSGTITMSNHFNAWASKGWNMGTHSLQIMAIKGYQSTGSADITVSESPVNPTPITATPTPGHTPTPRQEITPTPTPVRTATPRQGTPTPPGTIKIQFFNGNKSSLSNQLYLNFRVVNTGSSAIALSTVKMRYYYTKEGTAPESFHCDYSPVGNSNVIAAFVKMGTAKTGADTYVEVGFSSGAGSLNAGSSTQVQGRCAKNDWSNYTQSNDYSFNSSASDYVDWTKVTGYVSGSLAWGTEP